MDEKEAARAGAAWGVLSTLTGFDSNLLFMISYKVTERKVAVRSIG